MKISRAIFDAQRSPRFGTANPERIRAEFWEWMIRGDPRWRAGLGGGCLRNSNSAWHARNEFGLEARDENGPVWCFDRMGATVTELPDGRIVCIAGEHEDSYDPDFHIYNDVVVLGPNEEIEIYGYPRDVLPPTDFHTATLVGDRIVLIGRLGYPEDREVGTTHVHSLDLASFRIDPFPTSGDVPSWLYRHEARLDAERGVIVATGGQVLEYRNGSDLRVVPSVEDYELSLADGVWRRTTDRRWAIYNIWRADHSLFVLEEHPEPDSLFPHRLEYRQLPSDELNMARILVAGIPISYEVGVSRIVITIEGALPEALAELVVEAARKSVELQFDIRCEIDGP